MSKGGGRYKTLVTDDELYAAYDKVGRIASDLAAVLDCSPSAARKRVAKLLVSRGEAMMAEKLSPEVDNLIQHELAKSSISLEGTQIRSAWVKGKHLSVHIVPEPEIAHIKPLRIAFIDIETAPNLGYTWGKWEQNVIAFAREWFMLSFSVLWQGDEKPTTWALPDFPGYDDNRDNDAQLVAKLWAVLDEADIVVAHNGDKFDIKKANARFLQFEMSPPSPYRTIDTLKVARRHFALTSNKLDDVAKALGLGKKAETGGFQLWLDCMNGDRKAWAKMKRYNANDVVILERVYERLRPWHTLHPSIENGACAKCGSDNLIRRGFAIASGKRYRRLQCFGCGTWTREAA